MPHRQEKSDRLFSSDTLAYGIEFVNERISSYEEKKNMGEEKYL